VKSPRPQLCRIHVRGREARSTTPMGQVVAAGPQDLEPIRTGLSQFRRFRRLPLIEAGSGRSRTAPRNPPDHCGCDSPHGSEVGFST